MGINLSGPPRHSQEPRQDFTLPGGRGRSSTLSSGRPCPFLGSEDGPGLANNSPSRTNVCHAHHRKEWRGMVRVTIPYTRLTKEKQAQVCFAAFNQCPYHAQGAKMMEEHKHLLEEEVQHLKEAAAAGRKPKKRRAAHHSSAPMSNRKRTILQFTGLGVGAMVCAFVVSLVVSAEPGRMFDFIFDYLMLQDIKSMGMADKGHDKSETEGIVTGGNLKALKNLDAAQKEKLKARFSGMSEAEKAKLKEKYKAMMGR